MSLMKKYAVQWCRGEDAFKWFRFPLQSYLLVHGWLEATTFLPQEKLSSQPFCQLHPVLYPDGWQELTSSGTAVHWFWMGLKLLL
jgi:hypothetical protein